MKRLLLTNNGRGFVRFYEYTHKDAPYFSDLTSRSTHTSVLFVHATGFHGRIYDRTISYLNPSKYACYTYDQRGHGHSPWPDDAPKDVLTSWDGFGNDALDMSKYVYEQHDRPIIGVGHSQGATALVMAALKEPHLYKSLILYEPVIFPKLWRSLSKCFFCFSESPLAISSRKRRVEFDSRMDAFSNFAGKPPMRGFHVEVLKDYIRHGTVPCDGEEGKEDPRVRLLCDPNVEAMIYNSVHCHDTWDELHNLKVPAWIVSGKVDPFYISGVSKRISKLIPNCRYELWNSGGHFGPMQTPSKVSNLIERASFE